MQNVFKENVRIHKGRRFGGIGKDMLQARFYALVAFDMAVGEL